MVGASRGERWQRAYGVDDAGATTTAHPAHGLHRPEAARARPLVSVVIPCLNEASTIGGVVARTWEALAGLGVPAEVIVADNGSGDGSAQAAAAAGARVVRVTDRGYGNALNGGIRAALGRVIVILDGDGTYDPRDIPQLVSQLRGGYDIVIGSRYLGEREKGSMPLRSRIGNRLLTWLLNALYGTRLSDTHSGMRAFTKEAWQQSRLMSGGMTWAPEMCIKAASLGLRVAEVPIRYLAAPRGRRSHQRTLPDGWRHLRLLLAYRPEAYLLFPALLASAVGAAMTIAQMFVRLPAMAHLAMATGGAVLVSAGHAAIFAYLAARVFLTAIGLRSWTDRLDLALKHLTAERALIGIAAVACLALALGAASLAGWLQGGWGPMELGLMGLAIALGVTAFQSLLFLVLCSLIGEAAAYLRVAAGGQAGAYDPCASPS